MFKILLIFFLQKEHTKTCNEIKTNIDKIEQICQDLSSRDPKGLVKQVNEIQTEYEKLLEFLKDREKVC